jgi:hypothetical protein
MSVHMPEHKQIDLPQDTTEPRFRSLILEVAKPDIAFFKAIIESYDNLATLRTEDPKLSHLKLWFAPELEAHVNEILASLAPMMSIRIVSAA